MSIECAIRNVRNLLSNIQIFEDLFPIFALIVPIFYCSDGGNNWFCLTASELNNTLNLWFPTGRDSTTFRDNGTSVKGNLVIFLFWNVLFLFFVLFWESDFVPGRPGTEEFVPRFLLLPLSRNKGTAGQGNIFVPRDVLSPGNPSI